MRWIFLVLFGGCAMTTSVRVEKDWTQVQHNPYEGLQTVAEVNLRYER